MTSNMTVKRPAGSVVCRCSLLIAALPLMASCSLADRINRIEQTIEGVQEFQQNVLVGIRGEVKERQESYHSFVREEFETIRKAEEETEKVLQKGIADNQGEISRLREEMSLMREEMYDLNQNLKTEWEMLKSLF